MKQPESKKNNRWLNFLGNPDYFTSKMFNRQFGPALVSALGLGFGDMADSIVLGQKMGVTGLAALALIMPIFMVINVIMHGLGMGGCIIYSSLCAEGKADEAKRGFQGVITAAIIVGIVLAVLGNVFLPQLMLVLGTTPADMNLYVTASTYARYILCGIPIFFMAFILNYYLRNDDCEKYANYAFTFGTLVDIGLNIILVMFLGKGVVGAAMSTLMGMMSIVVLYLILILRKKTSISFSHFNPDFKSVFKSFKIGFSSSITYLFMLVFLILANNIIHNKAGETGVAVFDVLQSTSMLIAYLYDAINKSSQPIISTYSGEKNRDGMRMVYRFIIAIGAMMGVVLMAVCLVIPQSICFLFGLKELNSINMGNMAIRIFSLGILFLGINLISENYYQACMNEKMAYIISLLRTLIILIPMLILCSIMGIKTLWFFYPMTEFITFLMVRFLQKNKKLIDVFFNDERIFRKTIYSSITELGPLMSELEEFCEKWDANIKQSYFVNMAVEELCNVVMSKAFTDKNGFIQITVLANEDNEFELHFRDSAAEFDPFSLETDKASTDGEFDVDVMGIMMIKKKAKEFSYRHFQGFNTYIVKI